MGLSIHYHGRFKPEASLTEMIDEVIEFAKVFKWDYQVFERNFRQKPFPDNYDDNIFGIAIFPPDSEPVWFTFLANGRMSNPMLLKIWENDSHAYHKKYMYSLFTKTQFAGKQVHKQIIHIFRHFSKKYFKYFKMIDEGRYWETGEEEVLESQFKRYNYLLDMVGDALQNIPLKEGENLEEYFQNIADNIHKDYQKRKF
jgi:hypothetical protein